MTTVNKFVVGIIGIGMVTALLLPGRQTVPVINAFRGLLQGGLGTAMGTAQAARAA